MKPVTLQDYRERMLRVLVHIQRNLDRELSLEELAGVACFSPYHFHRIFRGMTGETLQGHIRRIRLERAAQRLKHGRMPVLEIALEAGYESHEAFTRAFAALTGRTPSAFRAERRPDPSGRAPAGVHFAPDGLLGDFEPLDDGGAGMDVHIQRLEPLRVAFVRHVGPYHEVGRAWDTLCTQLGAQGLLGAGSVFIGVCHDDPEVTPPEKIRYDACVSVDANCRPEGEIGVQTLEGGEYAVTTHEGPFERLGSTYARLLGQWIPRHGRTLRTAPSLEFYLNDPETTDPEDLLTDIYAPLEPLD